MYKLFPFQEEGSRWLSYKTRALLADEMGLGKSCQIVHAAKRINAKNGLISCPASLRANWMKEFIKWGYPGPFDILSSKNHSYKPGYIQIGSYNFFAEREPPHPRHVWRKVHGRRRGAHR